MAAGIPVVASNRGAIPEVTAGAADLVDAHDSDGLSHALERMLTDVDWARSHAIAGLARASSYTWEQTATRLHEAYLSATAHRARRR